MKKICSALLALVLLLSAVPFVDLSVTANAYTTPAEVSVNTVSSKANTLLSKLGGEGAYFTVNRSYCKSPRESGHSCSNCFNTTVAQQNWFINLFGNVSSTQFPQQYYPNGATGTAAGWSCHGFANFAMWYIFAQKPTDKVTSKKIGIYSLTKTNFDAYVWPGDVIRTSAGHSMLVLSWNSSNYTVIDCNYTGPNCQVHIGTRSYNNSNTFAISRAVNAVKTDSCNCSTSYAGEYTTKGVSSNLTIRSGHGTSYGVLGSIPAGATVTVTKADGNWAHVSYNGINGYASMDYLQKKNDPPRVIPSSSNIQLSVSGTKSQTINVSYAGSPLPDSIYVNYTTTGDCFTCKWGSWSNHVIPLTVTGTCAGQGTITIRMHDSANDETIATANVNVSVTAPTYTVSYNANGGSGAPSSQTKYYGKTLTLSSAKPTRSGFTFLGWATSSSATTAAYSAGGNYTSDSSVTLYAVWKSDPPRVIPSTNNVQLNVTGTNSQTINISYAGSPLPDSLSVKCTTTGDCFTYKWGSWSNHVIPLTVTGTCAGQGTITLLLYNWDTKETIATANVNVSVTAPTYTVSYNANGGSGAPSSQTKYYGKTLTLSSTKPTRPGYTFLGWATSSSATTAMYNAGGNYTSNSGATLYAVWKAEPTLSVNSSYTANITTGGQKAYYTFTPSTSGKYVIYSTGAYENDAYVVLYNASGTQLASNDDGAGDHQFLLAYSLTAGTTYRYEVRYYSSSKTGSIPFTFGNVYTVTYNANNGSGAPSSQDKYYGKTLTLSSTKPTRSGYSFLGWATSSSATTATYNAGGNYTSNSSVTLYAVWKANEYTVTYNANGGSGAPSSQIKYHGTDLTLSSVILTRSGYTFLGWATSSSATTATYTAGGKYTSDSSVTLYAVWKANVYYVTYDANGGSGAPSRQQIPASISSTIPTRTGYTFLGWSTNRNAVTASYHPGDFYSAAADVTLYAVWEEQATVMIGDINNDGETDAADAGLIARYDAGFTTLTEEQLLAGDVNHDGEVDAADAGLIARYDAGLITSF